jgi:hypothetical protein
MRDRGRATAASGKKRMHYQHLIKTAPSKPLGRAKRPWSVASASRPMLSPRRARSSRAARPGWARAAPWDGRRCAAALAPGVAGSAGRQGAPTPGGREGAGPPGVWLKQALEVGVRRARACGRSTGARAVHRPAHLDGQSGGPLGGGQTTSTGARRRRWGAAGL